MTKPTHPLSHPIYNTSVKLRFRSGRPTARRISSNEADCAKILLRTATGMSKQDHLDLASYHMQRFEKLNRVWLLLLDKYMIKVFGRPMGFFDYRVCAIGREEFTDVAKRVLRHCRYLASEHQSIAEAHLRVAKRI